MLSESQLAEMEAISASDPLAVDFRRAKSGAFGDGGPALGRGGSRQADPAKTASFDAMADRAQLLCYAAAEALRERHDASYDIQGYLDLTAQYVARCFWQLARLDEAAQNTSAYKEHLAQAGQLYYDCAVQCGVDDGSSFAVPQEDLTCCSPTAPIRGRPAASAARWSTSCSAMRRSTASTASPILPRQRGGDRPAAGRHRRLPRRLSRPRNLLDRRQPVGDRGGRL